VKQDVTNMPATRHQHHFEDLSPQQFESLVYCLVKRDREFAFDEVQWYGGVRDKGRDVVAYKHTETGREKWYIQCKRYKVITYADLRDELDKLARHTEAEQDFAPDVIVFATACGVSPGIKDKAGAYARVLDLPQPYCWDRLELDAMLNTQPETREQFFGTQSKALMVARAGLTGLLTATLVYGLINLLSSLTVSVLFLWEGRPHHGILAQIFENLYWPSLVCGVLGSVPISFCSVPTAIFGLVVSLQIKNRPNRILSVLVGIVGILDLLLFFFLRSLPDIERRLTR
jgi:hypothetical protein